MVLLMCAPRLGRYKEDVQEACDQFGRVHCFQFADRVVAEFEEPRDASDALQELGVLYESMSGKLCA